MDVEQIKSLIELMGANDLSEIMIRNGDYRVLIRRGTRVQAVPVASMAIPASLSPAAASPAGPPPAAEAALHAIKAPMVGAFYMSPQPDAPAFVKVGSHVDPDTVVCIIEAMKVFNEIKAEVSGVIERVMVENGGPVEFGQPLFLVRTPS